MPTTLYMLFFFQGGHGRGGGGVVYFFYVVCFFSSLIGNSNCVLFLRSFDQSVSQSVTHRLERG